MINRIFSVSNGALFTLVFAVFASLSVLAQPTPIPQSNYVIQDVSSQNATNTAVRAFDGNPATWWALSADGFTLPGVIEVDLGAVYDVAGFSYAPMATTGGANSRANDYEIYVSLDGLTWGSAQKSGSFPWASAADVTIQDIYFGAVTAQYVKMVYTTSSNVSGNILTSELFFYESDVVATGQENQTIAFDEIPRKDMNDPSFSITAVASSGLSITYSVVSGPATVSGNTVTLTGTTGTVVVKAQQAGNVTYYPAEITRVFEVVDASLIYPVVTTRLTENFPIEMPNLVAYPIYINAAIDEPMILSIDHVEVEIAGTTYAAVDAGDYYYYLWTPSANGSYTVNIRAVGTNGNETAITRNVTVTDVIATQNVVTMNDVVIQYGGTNSRWYYGTYSMPQHVGSYDQIMANLTIECPPGTNACDDWDRLAYIDVMGPDGNWIQIIRYITPYGVACNHEIDLTDYSSLLQGDFEFRMFIDTWGTGGWQVTLDFDHQQGAPQYLYTQVDEIWDGVWDLGNPSDLQQVPNVNYAYNSGCLSSHLRLSTTGHGWGSNNSQNAAEFYEATNFIDVDGSPFYTQNLWNDCNPNPDNCTGQQGTWTYSRAGWCPGAISHPNIVNMNSYLTSGPIDLAYRFDPTYVDYCHPNDPNCISGTTCPDCNDTYKAVYHVDAQLINFSNSPIVASTASIDNVDNTLSYDVNVYPNPSDGKFSIASSNLVGESNLYIQKISGEVVKAYNFKTSSQMNDFVFDLSGEAAGIYFISVENDAGQGVSRIIIE